MSTLRQSRAPLAGSILTGLVGQAVLIVSGVLAARILGVQDRGYFALLVLFPSVLAQIGSLGLPLAATFELSRDRTRWAEVIRTLQRPMLVQFVSLALLHAGILAAVFWSDPHAVRISALVSLCAVPAILGQSYGTAILQGQQRFLAFNVLRALPATAYSAAVLAIFLVGGGDLEWVVIGWAIASVVSAAVTLVVAVRGIALRSARRATGSLHAMLRFGLRGLLGWTSPVETFRLDQAVVGLFLTPAALGLYVVGLAFANLPRFIAQSVGYIAYPRVAAHQGREAWRELWQFFWLAAGASALVVLGLELGVARLVPLFFGSEFDGAVALTRILLVGALFLSARRVLTDGAQGLGRPGLGTIAELSSWIFLLPALGIFTPLWHARGVALALAVSAALSFVVLLALLVRGRPGPEAAPAPALRVRGAE
ncbi:MAG: oligosaccharide flippase family protein [Actinobacteria bacterium]|nr:oligosaccharide flippase family protein [Actinomycetota bacterium]